VLNHRLDGLSFWTHTCIKGRKVLQSVPEKLWLCPFRAAGEAGAFFLYRKVPTTPRPRSVLLAGPRLESTAPEMDSWIAEYNSHFPEAAGFQVSFFHCMYVTGNPEGCRAKQIRR
jgi:hypothetical protein